MTISPPSIESDYRHISHSPPHGNPTALLYGSVSEGLAFLALSVLVTLQISTSMYEPGPSISSSPQDKTWPHTDLAVGATVALSVATLLILPVAVGYFSRAWSWIGIYPAMLFMLSIFGFYIGAWATTALDLHVPADSWAIFEAMFLSILVPIVALVTSTLGTVLGKFVQGRRARNTRHSARSTII
jgi:hypothetical protein